MNRTPVPQEKNTDTVKCALLFNCKHFSQYKPILNRPKPNNIGVQTTNDNIRQANEAWYNARFCRQVMIFVLFLLVSSSSSSYKGRFKSLNTTVFVQRGTTCIAGQNPQSSF